ncbi:MAG: 2-succinyl-5-enolpyruvyl-6-hydroxy-3-cyclohexene-1-carboxylic-acid synthase [Acidimicrobiales bacterium]
MDAQPSTVQATFCATLVDEWVRAGVTHAVVAPGSRSTPLAVALTNEPRLRVEVFHDERAAGFAALGLALATGRPAVVVCTSGTATTHLHAAVVEADLSCVPLIVCTADRPPELRGVGAPQTIDQTHLYGRSPRWFFDPGVADIAAMASWRALAARAVAVASGAPRGPVHLNLPFREPLLGEVGALPPGRVDGSPWVELTRAKPESVVLANTARLVVIAGPAAPPGLAEAGWPVIADPGSGIHGRNVVAHADAILRVAYTADRLVPDVILRVGRQPASRVVNDWLARSGAEEWVVSDTWSDPAGTATHIRPADTMVELPTADTSYRDEWRLADDAAEDAIAAVLSGYELPTEPATARAVVAALPTGAHLVVASSMPVRDVEWFAPRRADLRIHANRGANGIDGTIATALGVAIANPVPVAVLLGDVAFLHDSTALIGVKARRVDLTIVVIDNDGGGIFSFLPQAAGLASEQFERLFGTPHGVRPEDIAAAHGIASLTVEDASALEPAIRSTFEAGGVWFVVVRTEREANVALHDELNAAVAKRLAC